MLNDRVLQQQRYLYVICRLSFEEFNIVWRQFCVRCKIEYFFKALQLSVYSCQL